MRRNNPILLDAYEKVKKMTYQSANSPVQQSLHPAAQWAHDQKFDQTALDCTTTVVLKILDGKCKMLPGEKAAIFEIYDVVRDQIERKHGIFTDRAHLHIDTARINPTSEILKQIHSLRVYAESRIAKPVMKQYKAMLRDGLFG